MHGYAHSPALLAWVQISWYLKQIRTTPPRSPAHRLEHHAGRHVARPTRTLSTTPSIFGAPPPKALAAVQPATRPGQLCRVAFVTVTH